MVKLGGGIRFGESVHACLGIGFVAQLLLARESDEGVVRQLVLGDDVLDGLVVVDGTLDVLAHHHCLCLAVQFVGVENLGVEVIHHDFSLCLDGLRIALHGLTYLFLCLFVVVFRIFLDAFNDLVVTLVGGIVG